MKNSLVHYRTSVCNINYHVVWSVKYRRKILIAEIEAYLKDLVQQIADEKGFTVQMFECGECDHVHCFITAPPKQILLEEEYLCFYHIRQKLFLIMITQTL